jgi:hypothetical protein
LARRETTEADLAQVDGYATADFTGPEKAVLRFTEAFYRDYSQIPRRSLWEVRSPTASST